MYLFVKSIHISFSCRYVSSFRRTLSMMSMILIATTLKAQTNSSFTNINIIPPSPNSASLGKYGEYPVSYNTGLPSIVIPITEIKAGAFNMPIQLSYHSGGLKVEEFSSWVGAGFSLVAGGVITRTVRGLPDEVDDGVHLGFDHSRERIRRYNQGGYSQQEKYQFLRTVAEGKCDTEPDQYYFNVGGKAGKLVFDEAGLARLAPFQNVKIERNGDTFIMTDVDGVRYSFFPSEFTTQSDACARFLWRSLSLAGISAI